MRSSWIRWALNAMTSVLEEKRREEKRREEKRRKEKRLSPCKDGGKDWKGVSKRQRALSMLAGTES